MWDVVACDLIDSSEKNQKVSILTVGYIEALWCLNFSHIQNQSVSLADLCKLTPGTPREDHQEAQPADSTRYQATSYFLVSMAPWLAQPFRARNWQQQQQDEGEIRHHVLQCKPEAQGHLSNTELVMRMALHKTQKSCICHIK